MTSQGLGAESKNLYPFLLPVIQLSTDVSQPPHVYLLEDGLELWYLHCTHTHTVTHTRMFTHTCVLTHAVFESFPTCDRGNARSSDANSQCHTPPGRCLSSTHCAQPPCRLTPSISLSVAPPLSNLSSFPAQPLTFLSLRQNSPHLSPRVPLLHRSAFLLFLTISELCSSSFSLLLPLSLSLLSRSLFSVLSLSYNALVPPPNRLQAVGLRWTRIPHT